VDALRKKIAAAAALMACTTLPVCAQESHLPIASGSTPSAVAVQLPTSPDAIAAGQQLFVSHCSFCHGPAGEGGKGPTLAQPSLPRATDDNVLLEIIRSGLPGTEMPSSRLKTEQLKSIAAFVRSLGRRPPEPVTGNPVRGAQLYATKGACAQCHSLHGHGGAIGPDLVGIGLRRSPAFLRRALIDPQAEIPLFYSAWRGDGGLPNNFLFVRAIPKSGEPVAGVRVNEDTFVILVRDLGGRLHSLLKADLAELHRDWGFSPMPVYSGVFTAAELDDVVAFLASLRGEK
jgi:putative heme-binding domain-containing protein